VNPEKRQTIQPIPITLYDSEPVYQQGKIISVNKKYMVYGIRGGFLRVINKFTAKRTLLKGHVQHLSDISFQNTDSNVLASVDKGGSLIVWEIIDGDGAVDYKKLVHLKQKEGEERYYKRLRWHPTHPGLLFTVSDKSEIDAWCIKKLRDGESVEYTIDGTFPEDAHTSIREASVVEAHDIGISFDGKFLATCGDTSNEVALWEVPEGGIGKYEHVVNWTPHGQEPLNSIHFLGSAQNRDMANFVITGGPCNQEFKVWSIQDVRKGIRLLQTVHFKPNPSFQPTHWDEQAFLNVCEVDPSSSFLVVCNQKESTACVLRIKTPYIDVDSDQLETRLDFLTEFELQQCVISFGLSTKGSKAQPEDGGSPDISVGLICIQTKSIQLWHLQKISPPAEQPKQEQKAVEDAPVENKEKDEDSNDKETEPESADKTQTLAKNGSSSSVDETREQRRQKMLALLGNSVGQAASAQKTPVKEESPTATPPPSAVPEPTADLTPVTDPAIVSMSQPAIPSGISDPASSADLGRGPMPALVSPAMLQSMMPLPSSTSAPQATAESSFTPAEAAAPAGDAAEDVEPAPRSPAGSPTEPEAPEMVEEPVPVPQPIIISGDSPDHKIFALLHKQLEDMQQAQARQYMQMQRLLKEQKEAHEKQMEEMRQNMVQQHQKHNEASFNHTKEQRQHMQQFGNHLHTTLAKQFQEMIRLLADKLSQYTDKMGPQFQAMQTQMEAKQKQFSDEMMREVKKDISQIKDQLASYIKHQKEYNELVKGKTKDTVEAEQQRMQKLLETVSHTILNTVPDRLEVMFETKLEQSIQKKVLQVLDKSIETKLGDKMKESMRLHFQKMLLPPFENSFQKIFDQVNTSLKASLQSQTEEINKNLRPEVVTTSLSRSLTDLEHVIGRTVGEQVARILPQTVNHMLETQLSQELPKLIQKTMTEVLTKMAGSNFLSADNAPTMEMPQEKTISDIKEEVSRMIQAKEFDEAFTRILSLSSIEMMEWLCGETDAKEVFEGSHPLTNAVILSLIQQLAFAINSQTSLKLGWLQECVIAFNPDDPVTKPHVQDVLGQVIVMLESFFSSTTEPEHKKSARAVLMMLKSVMP
jgi:WD40 repeat protein